MSGIFRSRVWLSGVALVALALALVAVISYWPSVQPAKQDSPKAQAGKDSSDPKSEDASLMELARRLLSQDGMVAMSSNGSENPPTPQFDLTPGRVPDSLPFTVSAKEGWRMVGGMYSSMGSMFSQWRIVIDASGPIPDVLSYYESDLSKQGFKFEDFDTSIGHYGGFVDTMFPGGMDRQQLEQNYSDKWGMKYFCRASDGVSGELRVSAIPGSPDDVRLEVRKYDMPGGPDCSTSPFRPTTQDDLKIPDLTPPEGVEVIPSGSGGGGGEWTTSANAKTDKSSASLEEHYAKQLEAAGWKRLDGRDDGALAWSRWEVPAKDKTQGFLYVLEVPGEYNRSLSLGVTSGNNDNGMMTLGVPDITIQDKSEGK